MKRFLNYLLIAATVCGISFAAASCSKDDGDNVEALTAEQLAGLWVTEYTASTPTARATTRATCWTARTTKVPCWCATKARCTSPSRAAP